MPEKIQLLKDPNVEPSDSVLETILDKEIFTLYKDIMDIIANKYGLVPEWRYYNDGKAWLCKVLNKKKTVFWLSVWDGLIKTSFFFTEKTRDAVFELDIDNKIKDEFEKVKIIGKLIPLILDINKKEQLKDLKKIIEYKKSLK
ncbi:MAG: DUF3788 domain-containing protein [Bacteroidales bacterium]|jgi:hypothetical protein|nr:DUF3788 domain-containing protein [Bacteroidales bacterium]